MKYIQNFESHRNRKFHTMESLVKLNEAEVSAEVLATLDSMLDPKATNKDTSQLKSELKDKLGSIQDQYKSNLKEYLKSQYDKGWFTELLETAVSPGSGLLSVAGLVGDKPEMVKKREEMLKKKDGEALGNATLKGVILTVLPDGTKLEEGLEKKGLTPSTDKLIDGLYEASMEVASKLFAGAQAGLEKLDSINFDFEDLDGHISAIQEEINKARKEMGELEDSKNNRDWVKKIELLCLVNCLRSRQAALLAAKAEYEFLTGSFEKTFMGKIEGYVQAIVEAAIAIFAAIICAKFISALGKTDFIRDVKKAVSDVAPTIIEGFQDGVNEVMASINPISKSPVFLGAVMAAYVIFQGGKLQEKLDFEEKEKYMILALEQFVPCITAVNAALAISDSTFNETLKLITDPNWGAASNDYYDAYNNLSDDDKERWLKQIKKGGPAKLFTTVMADVEASDSPMNIAIQKMQVGDDIKSSLSPSIIFNSPERGAGGWLYSFIGGDWLKGIKDIFDPLEKPLCSFEKEFKSADTYTKYVNKENPTHAAIGGLIFLVQTQAILKAPFDYMLPVKKKIPVAPVEPPKIETPVEVPKLEIKPLPPVLDISDDGGSAESCGVYVSIVDKDKNIYKSKIGLMYFKSGMASLAEGEDQSGVDGFSGLIEDYEFDYMVLGNADVTGPDVQKRKGGFIGNIELSRQRAQQFIGVLKKMPGVEVKSDGCGKKYARYYTDYMKKDLGTRKLADALKVKKDDKEFQANLSKDRRMEVIIFPKDGSFEKFSKDEALQEEVCKKQVKKEDERLIVKYGGNKNWSISKKAEELGLEFKKREEKKEEGKKEEGKANESVRYIMSLSDFMKS